MTSSEIRLLSPEARRSVEAQILARPTKAPRPKEHVNISVQVISGSTVRMESPTSIRITVPVRTKNPNNNIEPWRKVSARARKEKEIVTLMLCGKPLPVAPVTVQLTRHGKGNRPMDSDGLAASLKHVRDSVAAVYGLDDADPRIVFLEPKQATAAKEYGVTIEISASHPALAGREE